MIVRRLAKDLRFPNLSSVHISIGRSAVSHYLHWLLTAAFVLVCLTSMPETAQAQVFSDSRFGSELVASLGSSAPSGIAWSPDGRMFVLQKTGIIRIARNGVLLPEPFLDFTSRTNIRGDLGMLGIAFHPDFANNGWVYLAYVYEPSGVPDAPGRKVSRVSRVTADPANPDIMLANSEVVVLGTLGAASCDGFPLTADCMPADDTTRAIGALRFGADGKLFVGNGDGASSAFGDSNALRAQSLDSLGGKILRINDDGSAPADNPFYDGTNSNRSKVWAYGLRNPFRFTLNAATREPWAGDIGSNIAQEMDRVPRGANLGWPCYEGADVQAEFSAFAECSQLAPGSVTAPIYAYDSNIGSAAIGGAFYAGTLYPADFRGSFFFADVNGGWIRRIIFNPGGSMAVSVFATGVNSPVAIETGPDGMLYYVSRTSGEIRRIRYNGPTAVVSALPANGYSPLTVNFSSLGSKDASGGTALTYLWNFGDSTTSTATNPVHTYTAAGVSTFTAQLTVTATASGTQASASIPVTVGSQPPSVTITAPTNGQVVTPGQVINYQGFATDSDEGALSGSSLNWQILLYHNTHVHEVGTSSGTTGSLTIENHGAGSIAYEIILTATDSSGLATSKSVTLTIPNTAGPPSAPGTPVATPVNPTRIDLSWAPSTGTLGIAGYRVERCKGAGCTTFTLVGSPYGPNFSDLGLSASATYAYRVRAIDAASSLSPYSNTVTVTTPTPPYMVGLVAAYGFSEGAGSTSADLSPAGNLLTLNTATWSTQGKFGNSLSFAGGQLATVADANSLDLSNALTLEAWVYPTAPVNQWASILLKEQPNDMIYSLYAGGPWGGVPTAWGYTTSDAVVQGTSALPANAWTHLASTFDGAQLRLYVNGALAGTQPLSGSLAASNGALRIGGNTVWSEFFTGRIDEVRVFNRVLSATEIQADMSRPIDEQDTVAPTAPQTLNAVATSSSRIDLTWAPSTDNIGVSSYQVERCAGTGCSGFAQIGTAPAATYSDNSAAASTTYIYRVRALDAAGNTSGYSGTTTATTPAPPDTTAPSAPGTLTATAISATQINLAWGAATDNVAVTGYRVERCAGAGCSNFVEIATPATNAFNDTTVAGATSYSYRVRAVDAAVNLGAYSNTSAATTPAVPDTTAPSAPGTLTATAISATQINLNWGAATDNVAVTGYRVERCAGAACSNFVEIATPATNAFNDTTVAGATSYSYRVRAVDAAVNLGAYSNTSAATTPAVPDTTAPGAPGTLTATAISATQINLNWGAATDNVAVTGYRVERCAGAACSNFVEIATPASNTFNDTTVAGATSYSYRVRAVDAAVNLGAYSNTSAATTPAVPDTTAPSAPGTLTATAISATQINLAWGAATDNVAVTGYRVERCAGAACSNFVEIATPASIAFNDTTVAGATTYSYRVRAVDAAVNLGAYSNTSAATTPAVPDTTAPSAPGTLTATAISATQINLNWGAATDNVAVTGYRVERCAGAACSNFVEIATPASIAFNDTTVAGATTYSYRVRAVDAAVNLGAYSNTSAATTPAVPDTTAPSAPGTLTATAISATQINLNWGAATDNVAVTGYRVERCAGAACSNFVEIATPASNTFNDTTVAGATSYSYRVRAVDAAVNLGAYSNTSTATTPAPPDTTAPSAPGTLTATAAGGAQINLGWGAALDDVGVTGYRVERCTGAGCTAFAQIATPSGTTYGDSSVSASITYVYRVRAVDSAGNAGNYSNTATATAVAPSANLVAAYSFSEGSGATTLDISGNGNNGAIGGAAWTSGGRFGKALEFNGNQMVTISDSNVLDLTNGMTLEAWVYPTAMPTDWGTVIYKEQSSGSVYGMYSGNPYSNQPEGLAFVSTPNPVGAKLSLAPNTWTHLATTYDGATLRIFVNGVQTASKALAGNLRVSTGALRIGGNAIWGEYFRGRIDEVRVYSRALDAMSIQTDMYSPVDQGSSDVTAPTAPGAPTVIAGSNRTDLNWTSSTDDVGVSNYRIERCTGSGCSSFTHIGTSPTAAHADTSAAPLTTYVYRVRAVDAAGKLSAYSAETTTTTAAAAPTVQGKSALWKCNLPGCTASDWVGAVMDWPANSAYTSNNRTGGNSRSVYSPSGTPLYPYMGAWATGCSVTAVTGQTLIIEWQRGSSLWRETLLQPGQSHTISLMGLENGALIETLDGVTSFSASLSNCNPAALPTP